MIEEEVVTPEAAIDESAPANPVVVLTDAQLHAAMLGEAGATSDIRYAGKKAAEVLGRLLGHMEKHRRIVGAPS